MDRNVYTYEDLKEVEKSANKMYEIRCNEKVNKLHEELKAFDASQEKFCQTMYQQKHKKVKDRYSTDAFYANNFKHDKKSK